MNGTQPGRTTGVTAEPASVAAGGDFRQAGQAWRPLLVMAPLVVFLLVFFVGPLLLNVQASITSAGGHSLSAAPYLRILTDSYYLHVLLQTLALAFGVVLICLVVGYPLAYAIARAQGGWKSALVIILAAPLLVNVVVRSFGWMVILGNNGMINVLLHAVGLPQVGLMYTWTGIVIALVHVLLPFMVLAIASTLETLDARIEEAAQVLGAHRGRVFLHVTLPLSMEGIITGSILTFTLTLGSFVTVMLLGNNGTMILPLLIYQRLTVSSDWATAATLGVILLVVVTIILWAQGRLRRLRPGATA
jgi:ABC-type spermidine/putrescine transport system permease subunit I